jgi:nitrite reductase (NADH) large subunit
VYRTIDDLDAIIATAANSRVQRGVVVGGGLLGLEAAKSLSDTGFNHLCSRVCPTIDGRSA